MNLTILKSDKVQCANTTQAKKKTEKKANEKISVYEQWNKRKLKNKKKNALRV